MVDIKKEGRPLSARFGTREYEVPTEENREEEKRKRRFPDVTEKEVEEYLRLRTLGGPQAERKLRPQMKKGGMVSASKRADGCAIKGKTKGRII